MGLPVGEAVGAFKGLAEVGDELGVADGGFTGALEGVSVGLPLGL